MVDASAMRSLGAGWLLLVTGVAAHRPSTATLRPSQRVALARAPPLCLCARNEADDTGADGRPPETSREAKRRARLLGEVAGGTTQDELSGFEELFANLREEEERAVVAAHEQEMVALLEELENGGAEAGTPAAVPAEPPQPPARARSAAPSAPRARGAAERLHAALRSRFTVA